MNVWILLGLLAWFVVPPLCWVWMRRALERRNGPTRRSEWGRPGGAG